MARPRSLDKRTAILAAAVKVFAERGLEAAPTSAISAAAGVAEGTLFTYFKTKDELVNALYRDIKGEFAQAMLEHPNPAADVRARLRQVWDGLVGWGVDHADCRKVMLQLGLSARLTPETRVVTQLPFERLFHLAEVAIAQGQLRDIPVEFLLTSMNALAENTMAFVIDHPADAQRYLDDGFNLLWDGATPG